MTYHSVILNGEKWLILNVTGDKYFMLAEKPLFRGYYSLQPCEYAESRLAAFLTNRYLLQLKQGGVDTSKIVNLCIPTLGQYSLYIKDKLPNTKVDYLLRTPHQRQKDCMLAIGTNGEMCAVQVTEPCGIRPCMFADKQYINSLAGAEADLLPIPDAEPENAVVVQEASHPDSSPASESEQQWKEESDIPGTEKQESDGDEHADDNVVETEETKEPEVSETKETREAQIEKSETETIPIPDGEAEKTVKVERFGASAAVYVFADYQDYGVLCENDTEEVKKTIAAYSATIKDFLHSSNSTVRKDVSKEDVLSLMRSRQERWRWKTD